MQREKNIAGIDLEYIHSFYHGTRGILWVPQKAIILKLLLKANACLHWHSELIIYYFYIYSMWQFSFFFKVKYSIYISINLVFFKFKGFLLFWSFSCIKSARNISSMLYWLKVLSKLSKKKKKGAVTPVQDYCERTQLIFYCFLWNGAVPLDQNHNSWHILLNTSFSEIFAGHKETFKKSGLHHFFFLLFLLL